MKAPLLLVIAVLILLFLIVLWIFFNDKIKNWLNKISTMNLKIQTEDSLKFFYEAEYLHKTVFNKELAKKLGVKQKQADKIIGKLISMKFATNESGELKLTNEGRKNAIKIVRSHRLLEKYLAEETSVQPKNWHTEAEFDEHRIKEERIEEIASLLGNPIVDPHGDPIPLASGKLPDLPYFSILDSETGSIVKIAHIEDEPPEIYEQIIALNIFPGTKLKIISKDENIITLEINGENKTLTASIARNISVRQVSPEEFTEEKLLSLNKLPINKETEIVKISEGLLGQQRRRLLDLGFVKGSKVKALLKGIGGDPTAYLIKNTTIALRENISRWILVKRPENE